MNRRQKGLRCQICTGCGLCPGVAAAGSAAGKMHILTENPFPESQPLPEGERLAVADIGTTTIAMLLYAADGTVCDRYVAVNPQTEYGADVISRIRAAEDKAVAEELQRLVKQVLESGLQRFCSYLAPEEKLLLVLAANTTETYLLMGWDTSELGCAPFRVSHREAVSTGETFVFPALSAFVGGDITADIYACGMTEKPEITLLIDLGTNGEIALGNSLRRIACSTAAGPAFEGGVNRGIWGADMISLLATLRREGILDENGLLGEPYFEQGIRIGNVCVTQEAVRAVQLAKAAIAAGITVLLGKYGIGEEQVDRVILAGGFGYYLKPEDAAEIGLLPAHLAGKAVPGGNLVLAGARRAGGKLLAGESLLLERELRELQSGTELVNLAGEPEFAGLYIEGMALRRR